MDRNDIALLGRYMADINSALDRLLEKKRFKSLLKTEFVPEELIDIHNAWASIQIFILNKYTWIVEEDQRG